MAIIQIKVPSPGESISEVTISRWLKKDGEYVVKDEEILEIDSDKATLTVCSEATGVLKYHAKEGDTVKVDSLVGEIDTSAAPAVQSNNKIETPVIKSEAKKAKPAETIPYSAENNKQATDTVHITPLAKKIMQENKITEKITGSGENGKITKADVLLSLNKKEEEKKPEGLREEERKKMSSLRKRLAERLVAVKNQTAMLTTFNEIDMTKILELRTKYNPQIEMQFGIKLGFMSFFTKAVCQALELFPAVNAMIEGEEIIFHKYCDIGIAVSTPKGLVVPILRNAEKMTLVEIEKKIKELAEKARNSKLTLDDMAGGTFTITNGGVFGSLMSTPIINPPQVAILGLHKVLDRPVAVAGKIEIRPMMYVALSYDHRIIDGRESVGFLIKVKELYENPIKMLFGGRSPEEVLLGII